MKNILFYIAIILTLMTLTACGGGGGSTQAPATTYTLTFVSGGNGTLTGTATQTVNQGANASTVTAAPATGYHFVNWTEGVNVVSTNAAYSVTNVSANHSYTANFAVDAPTNYTLSFTSSGNGTLSGTVPQAVNQGASSSTVTAVPASGYHFVNWTEGATVVGTTADLTVFNISSNHSYTANFAITPKTTATLKINLTGTLPAATTISGTSFILTLPANVTPAMTGSSVSSGVVSYSGTFAGSTILPEAVYTAATASTAGSLYVILTSSVLAGVSRVGEVATITLQLANGATPTAASFGVSEAGVFDAVLYSPISGMGVSIANVTLQ